MRPCTDEQWKNVQTKRAEKGIQENTPTNSYCKFPSNIHALTQREWHKIQKEKEIKN